MFRRILMALSLFLVAGSCFAQSDLVMYDAEGDRVGTVITYNPLSDTIANLYTPDAYFISVYMMNGGIAPGASLYYTSADCSGQAYITANYQSATWEKLGGVILYFVPGAAKLERGTQPIPAETASAPFFEEVGIALQKYATGGLIDGHFCHTVENLPQQQKPLLFAAAIGFVVVPIGNHGFLIIEYVQLEPLAIICGVVPATVKSLIEVRVDFIQHGAPLSGGLLKSCHIYL